MYPLPAANTVRPSAISAVSKASHVNDADQAVEWAERMILESRGLTEHDVVPLGSFQLVEGLSREQLARIEGTLRMIAGVQNRGR